MRYSSEENRGDAIGRRDLQEKRGCCTLFAPPEQWSYRGNEVALPVHRWPPSVIFRTALGYTSCMHPGITLCSAHLAAVIALSRQCRLYLAHRSSFFSDSASSTASSSLGGRVCKNSVNFWRSSAVSLIRNDWSIRPVRSAICQHC